MGPNEDIDARAREDDLRPVDWAAAPLAGTKRPPRLREASIPGEGAGEVEAEYKV